MKKILITGVAGFIGSHIADAYIQAGHEVWGIDNLSTGKLENINPKVKFIEADIRNIHQYANLFNTLDVINHHAAQTSVGFSVANPWIDADNNITGTINLLYLARKCHVKRFIFASSAAVYGKIEIFPVTTTHSTNPISPYGISKLTAEKYIQLLSDNYIIFRYANIFGNRQKKDIDGGVLSIFKDRIKRHLPLVIYGDGEQTRQFVSIKDIVKLNLIALEKKNIGIFNIPGERYTINEIHKLLSKALNKKIPVSYENLRPGDIKHMVMQGTGLFYLTNLFEDYSCQNKIREYFLTKE